MADEGNNKGQQTQQQAQPRFTTGFDPEETVSAEIGIRDSSGNSARTANTDATSIDLDREGTTTTTTTGADKVAEGEQEAAEGREQEKKEEDGTDEQPKDEGGELPDYNPDDAAVQEQYDARYFKDGKLSQASLSEEFWKNYAGTKDKAAAGLNENTYKYLETTLGVSKETAKEIERGLVASAREREAASVAKVPGGLKHLNAAIEWGGKNYSPEQKARFNSLRQRGGPEFDEAVDALLARYERATGNRPAQQNQGNNRRGPPGRRNATPQRSVTAGANAETAPGPTTGQGFASPAAYQDALTAAHKEAKAARTSQERRAARDKIEGLRRRARQHGVGNTTNQE